MRALNSRLILIDITNDAVSWSHRQRHSHFITMSQRGGAHQRMSTSPLKQSQPSILRTPQIRKPSDRATSSNGSSSALTSRLEACTELDLFLEMLPLRVRRELSRHGEIGELIEVVMDLGRKPLARFPFGDWIISDQPVKHEDLVHATSKVGDFSDDNRSGIDRSLHRISAIRNRKLQIIGLTCRVGRAVSGSAEIIRDLVEGGGSILVIGPPGVGKTTLIREIARMLADEHMKRVVIVDTSNEIGGDGDVPHEGIGRARRMQVPNVNLQHNVMIEAVENHMPETIIIDEIGTELEALAASTIAQRGVQLVGTAHGMTIDNIIKNPSLQILVGGIESVTLGDEEARKRKVQKTILERKGPPTFTCAVEMISKTECRVHHRLDATVDAILAGRSPLFETRQMEPEASVPIKSIVMAKIDHRELSHMLLNEGKSAEVHYDEEDEQSVLHVNEEKRAEVDFGDEDEDDLPIPRKKHRFTRSASKRSSPIFVYTYKILETDLLQVATVMGLEDEIDVTDDIGMADAVLVSASEIKQNPWIRGIAKFHKLPMFVIKSNTMAQMVKAVRMILERESYTSKSRLLNINSSDIEVEDDAPKRKPTLEEIDALEEVRLAIEYIVIPGGEPVELLPRRSEIIARQLELVKSYQLDAENSGTELNPRLQILPHRLNKKLPSKSLKTTSNLQNETGLKPLTDTNGGTSVTRLPFLPE
ncbi:RNA-binding family protein with retrovirus zinc finger-like domain isoform 1 [Hibiscus syriacus]|uniref:RNA-binding family protein with retrovirus zinc finger-like domain isoform 1 n=1 Tax=Hibiscus syriacus TaxID=106335 RepID=A0A6A2YDX9_HIBSY|nr:protein SEEDLING PLASTID DEVELOPMENT 1-like [Hibiscus syriacus]KAE8670664.1 RNA-binding family protein with retrovirus zinc finger-like domain isoform 1 [Hibiscus syriacus]